MIEIVSNTCQSSKSTPKWVQPLKTSKNRSTSSLFTRLSKSKYYANSRHEILIPDFLLFPFYSAADTQLTVNFWFLFIEMKINFLFCQVFLVFSRLMIWKEKQKLKKSKERKKKWMENCFLISRSRQQSNKANANFRVSKKCKKWKLSNFP